MRSELSRRTWIAACLLATACGGGSHDTVSDASDAPVDSGAMPPVMVDVNADPPAQLSAYHFFRWSAAAGFQFNDRVVPYDINTALFSDGALKQRAIYIPPGASATYDAEQALDLPVGSVIVKTFAFAADLRAPADNVKLIETRLMVRHADGWHPLPYIWSDDQQDAVLSPAGDVRTISYTDATGAPQTANYLIPQRNQCQTCHARQADLGDPLEIVLIGVKARHLNRSYDFGTGIGVKNQLDHLTELGMLTGAPAVSDIPAAYDFRPIEAGGAAAIPPADVDTAARSYLDINCAHCHNPQGVSGRTSQLFLNHDNTDLFRLGDCKRPGSAGPGTGGFQFDIVPGDPDTSILYFRVHTTDVGAMMPLLGRSVTHVRGAELLHAWIAAMPPDDCMTAP